MREKINHYNFKVLYILGKKHLIEDALSRNPLNGTFEDNKPLQEEDVVHRTAYYLAHVSPDDPLFGDIFEGVSTDRGYKSVVEALQSDVALEDLDPKHPARKYKNVWDQLCLLDKEENTLMVMQGDQGSVIVIPQGH